MVDGPPGPVGTWESAGLSLGWLEGVNRKSTTGGSVSESLGVHETTGRLVPINLRKVIRSEDPDRPTVLYRVGRFPLRVSTQEYDEHMEELVSLLNGLETAKAQLEAELTEVQETCKSLREDLSNFSTFEQICNSGMLRNFKIDSESPFAQVILRLLQQTMELQLSHLRRDHESDPEPPVRTTLPKEGWNSNPGVSEP